jgi:hypothetical protein
VLWAQAGCGHSPSCGSRPSQRLHGGAAPQSIACAGPAATARARRAPPAARPYSRQTASPLGESQTFHPLTAPPLLCCRKCRDIPFALLFAAFWGGVISIAGVAFHQGNPAVLLYGLDYDGHVCGKNQPGANLLPYKAQYWVNPNEARTPSRASSPPPCFAVTPPLTGPTRPPTPHR